MVDRAGPPVRHGTFATAAQAAARASPRWASTSSTCRRSTRSAGSTARAATTRWSPGPRTSARRGRSAPPRAATTRSTPSSARSADFRAFVAAARDERPRGRARPGAAVRAGPPVGHRAPGVVHHPAGRHDRLRREPAEEVPGHLPAQLRQRPGGHPRRGAARRAALGRAGRQDLPGRQPAHQAARLLGLADLDGQGRSTRTCCSWPRRSPGRRSCTGSARSASPSPTRTSPGAPPPRELREYCEELVAAADHMRPNFWPNTPDILHESLQHGGPAMFKIRAVLASLLVAVLGHLRRLRAVRARRPARRRGVPRQREVRAAPAAVGGGREGRRVAGPVPHPAQRDPPRQPGPALAAQPALPRRRQRRACCAGPSGTPTPTTRSWSSARWTPSTRTGATPRSTCRRSASTGTSGSRSATQLTGAEFSWGQHNAVHLDPQGTIAHVVHWSRRDRAAAVTPLDGGHRRTEPRPARRARAHPAGDGDA